MLYEEPGAHHAAVSFDICLERAPRWDALLQAQTGDRVIASDAEVGAIAFLADGSTLAGSCRDGKLRLWDVRSGALKRSFPWDKGDTVVTISAGAGLLAAVGKEGGIRTWNLQSGEPPRPISGPTQKVRRLAFSADRSLMAVSTRPQGNGSEDTVRLLDASGKERFAVPAGLGGTSAHGHPARRRIYRRRQLRYRCQSVEHPRR